MDEVDYRYKDSIRGALQNKNLYRLQELIPSLEEETLQNYINT